MHFANECVNQILKLILSGERMYDESLFRYQVERFRIDDHNVPTLRYFRPHAKKKKTNAFGCFKAIVFRSLPRHSEMQRFARIARDWMDADPKNVIAIHCKGGKGRTGTMICVWLIESGTFEQATVSRAWCSLEGYRFHLCLLPQTGAMNKLFSQDSLEYFGTRRTDLSVGKKYQGIETPSQVLIIFLFWIWVSVTAVHCTLRAAAPAAEPASCSGQLKSNVCRVGAVAFGIGLRFFICNTFLMNMQCLLPVCVTPNQNLEILCSFQSRYVGYFEAMKSQFGGELPPRKQMQLNTVIIHNLSGC